jgi:hypothetical protein
MSPEAPHPPTPVHQHVDRHAEGAPNASAQRMGGVALLLCGLALVSAPLLILVPYIGFLPALVAATAVVIACLALRRGHQRNGMAVAALIVGVALFALLGGVATAWNLMIVNPAISDYDELHSILDRIPDLIFGKR